MFNSWRQSSSLFSNNSYSCFILKNALESFPELTIITRDSKAKSGGSAISKIKMNGKAYNKKTLRTSKTTTQCAQVSIY